MAHPQQYARDCHALIGQAIPDQDPTNHEPNLRHKLKLLWYMEAWMAPLSQTHLYQPLFGIVELDVLQHGVPKCDGLLASL